MAGFSVSSAAYQVVEWFEGKGADPAEEARPMRTVYNARTHQDEEIPLPEFQRLLRQGKI